VPADQVNAAKTYSFLANELWALQKAIAKAKVNEEVERIAS
jgi:hypothetical protein